MSSLRWALTLPFAVFVLLGVLDVRNPDAIVLAVLALVGVALGRRRIRAALQTARLNSRGLRIADLILWNAFLAFALAETGLVLADYMTPRPLWMAPNAKSQERIERYKASLKTRTALDPRNSGGFNDSEWAVPKPRGTLRIVALGDSFAFGVVGYEKNFLTLLEGKLAGCVPERVEICNLGIPALDPIDYLQLLSLEGERLDPDLVLVCLFAGNDFVRTARGSRLRLRNSRTFSVLWRLWRLHREAVRRRTAPRTSRQPLSGFVPPPAFSDATYLEIASRYLDILRKTYGPETQARIRDTLAVLDRIAARTGDRRLVVAVLPCEVQVNPDLRRKVCRRAGVSEADLDLGHPARLVGQHFRGREVTVVDLLPNFQAAHPQGTTYRPNDSHWNARGNRVAADALVPDLERALRICGATHPDTHQKTGPS